MDRNIKLEYKNSKSPASGVSQVSEEGTPASSELKGGIVPGLKMDLVRFQESVPRGSGNADPPETEAPAMVFQKLKGIHFTPRKQSGAQRKKLAKLKAAETGREWLPKKDWRERKREQKSSSAIHQSGEQGEAPPIASDGADKEKEMIAAETLHPKTCQTPKRPWSEVSTSSTESEKARAQESKRVKIPEEEAISSSRYSLSTHRMAIVLDSYPNDLLVEEQADLLQQKLVEQISSEKFTGGIRPQFRSCYLSRGALIIVCESEMARLWLGKVVPELRLWKGAKLKVGPAKDVLTTAKVTMWVSGVLKNASPSAILEKLRVQNEGLETAGWRVINRKVESKGQTLVFTLPEQTLSWLKRSNFEVFLGLEVVKLRIVSKPMVGAQDHGSSQIAGGCFR
ncbi:uncharacterized protein [Rhodnius prolixus]|uniref:DUF4780 domain-containing protein n=2 Tax=Rhodnius TaxID=13248 RepID=T1IFP8_RHOPR